MKFPVVDMGRTSKTNVPRTPGLSAIVRASLALSCCLWAGCSGSSPNLPAPDRIHLFESARVEQVWKRLPALKSDLGDRHLRVPNLAPSSLPEDLNVLPVHTRKYVFIRALLPHLLYQNDIIAKDRADAREALETLLRNEIVPERQRIRVTALLKRYRFRGPHEQRAVDADSLRDLLRRVDEVPVPLALSQAAIESGWGISRFAREGNNIFGHWKTTGGTGMIPDDRPEGATYSLAVFPHISAAVEKYFLNLNTHGAYRAFRDLRFRMRQEGRAPDSLELAGALEDYSARGKEYVQDVRMIMAQNGLKDLARAFLVYSADTRNLLLTLTSSASGAEMALKRRTDGKGQVQG